MNGHSRIEGYGKRYIILTSGVIFTNKMKIKSTQITNAGYELVHLSNGKRRAHTMHRLLALTFLPNPEGKLFVNHKDGNKLNNHVDNLEWVTPKENIDHAHNTGLMSRKGMKNSKSKFKDSDIITIRERCAAGETNVAIAETYGVDPSTISVIRHGKTWTHITAFS